MQHVERPHLYFGMTKVTAPPTHGRKITQQRGQKTYSALIATGFKLLETKKLESTTIAEFAHAAGYSVGAFYARFRSKDEFFHAMVAHHLEKRARIREHLFATAPNESLIDDLIAELVTYYWKRRMFWRAALIHSIRDPDFWKPIRQQGYDIGNALIARITDHTKGRLTTTEEENVRFALQITLGTLNNSIINQPGPLFPGQAIFITSLVRAFRLVSDYDRLMGLETAAQRSAPTTPT